MRIATFGDDRLQCRHAELGCLLHHEVGGVPLQQGERQPEIGFLRLGPRPVLDAEAGAVAPDGLDACAELAVAPVEQQHGIAWPPAHDRPQIVRLRRGRRDGVARGQGGSDMEAD